MDLLLFPNGVIDLVAPKIVWGTFEEEQKWALYDENHNIIMYALDANFHVETVAADALPEDIYIEGKYIYQNGEIVQNPEWTAPPPTVEEQVDVLNESMDSVMTEVIPSTTEAMQMQIDALSEAIDDVLTNVIPMLMGDE